MTFYIVVKFSRRLLPFLTPKLLKISLSNSHKEAKIQIQNSHKTLPEATNFYNVANCKIVLLIKRSAFVRLITTCYNLLLFCSLPLTRPFFSFSLVFLRRNLGTPISAFGIPGSRFLAVLIILFYVHYFRILFLNN